tara:strand:- start:1026 stop:1868 length:843 start_codon:yes stop_codon:yes gene_type:complete
MEYLTGYTIKPHSTTPLGSVVFTDGTNTEIQPNQQTCEAYGYTYDRASGMCMAFMYNENLNRNISNENNKNNGSGNTNQLGANTIQVNGTLNTTKGFNNNCFINGAVNEIANGVDNATVLGAKGEATTKNAFVIGGNQGDETKNIVQNTTVMCNVKTSNNTVTDSPINGETGVNLEVPVNTIITFRSETVGVRYSGTGGGNPGDFKSFVETGAVINRNGTLTIDKSRVTTGNVGTTSGWTSDIVASGTTLTQTVKGANNRNIMWATTIIMTQLKTGEALT